MKTKKYIYCASSLYYLISKYEIVSRTKHTYKIKFDNSTITLKKTTKHGEVFETLQEAKEYLIEKLNIEIYKNNEILKDLIYDKEVVNSYSEKNFKANS